MNISSNSLKSKPEEREEPIDIGMFKKSFNEKGDKEMNFLADSQNLVLDSMNYSRFAEKIVYNMQIAMEYENYYYFAENNF